MEIFTMFGLDVKQFAAQVVNFLIIVVIIRMFLYEPVRSMLRARQEKIKKGLDDSAAATVLLEKTTQEKAEILKGARVEIEGLLDDARVNADMIKQKVIEDSRREAGRIVAQAKEEARREMEIMKQQVTAMSLALSEKMLASLLPSLLSEEQKTTVMRKAVQQLEQETHEHGND